MTLELLQTTVECINIILHILFDVVISSFAIVILLQFAHFSFYYSVLFFDSFGIVCAFTMLFLKVKRVIFDCELFLIVE